MLNRLVAQATFPVLTLLLLYFQRLVCSQLFWWHHESLMLTAKSKGGTLAEKIR